MVCAALVLLACLPMDEAMIGPDGGVLVSEDGLVTLVIPQGALAAEIPARLTSTRSGPTEAIGPVVALQPDRHPLLIPAEVYFDVYEPEPGLRLVGRRDDAWVSLPDLELDVDASLLSASLTYFTVVAVVTAECSPRGTPVPCERP